MNAARNPDGDVPHWRRLAFEAKSAVKRRLASAGTPVDPPPKPYLVVPILGQSNASGWEGVSTATGWTAHTHGCTNTP